MLNELVVKKIMSTKINDKEIKLSKVTSRVDREEGWVVSSYENEWEYFDNYEKALSRIAILMKGA